MLISRFFRWPVSTIPAHAELSSVSACHEDICNTQICP
uniref:MH1 domain-containing protein n=1 Tax=Anguilla anguilla TaxID=7936 RepID=A0A0E9V7I3_ANGAN